MRRRVVCKAGRRLHKQQTDVVKSGGRHDSKAKGHIPPPRIRQPTGARPLQRGAQQIRPSIYRNPLVRTMPIQSQPIGQRAFRSSAAHVTPPAQGAMHKGLLLAVQVGWQAGARPDRAVLHAIFWAVWRAAQPVTRQGLMRLAVDWQTHHFRCTRRRRAHKLQKPGVLHRREPRCEVLGFPYTVLAGT